MRSHMTNGLFILPTFLQQETLMSILFQRYRLHASHNQNTRSTAEGTVAGLTENLLSDDQGVRRKACADDLKW